MLYHYRSGTDPCWGQRWSFSIFPMRAWTCWRMQGIWGCRFRRRWRMCWNSCMTEGKGENSTINDEWASYEKNVRFLGFIDLDFLWSKICVDFLKNYWRAENRVVWSFEERDYFKGKPVERQGRKARRD